MAKIKLSPVPSQIGAMRVGVISPNVILNLDDVNRMATDPDLPWRFDSLAKKVSLLFDKIYLTPDLDVTYQILQSVDGDDENNPQVATLRYLVDQGLILTPQSLGYSSGKQFLNANTKGTASKINHQLMRIGNPGIEEDQDEILIGQPDVGWLAAHDGWHPRLHRKGFAGMSLSRQERAYESLLLRRNAALLRMAGIPDVSVVGRLFEDTVTAKSSYPVWKVVFKEMPQLDTRASWQDVLDFRKEEKTQHLIRSLRRWIRKTVSEEWTQAELEDEVRELVYEYENHLRIAHMSANKGVFETLITGAAELAENIVKLRFGKIAKLVTAIRNRKVKLLEEEANAPGREIALIPELKNRF
jgi:hypothetical protein